LSPDLIVLDVDNKLPARKELLTDKQLPKATAPKTEVLAPDERLPKRLNPEPSLVDALTERVEPNTRKSTTVDLDPSLAMEKTDMPLAILTLALRDSEEPKVK